MSAKIPTWALLLAVAGVGLYLYKRTASAGRRDGTDTGPSSIPTPRALPQNPAALSPITVNPDLVQPTDVNFDPNTLESSWDWLWKNLANVTPIPPF